MHVLEYEEDFIADEINGSCSTQIIDGDGNFNQSGLEKFVKETEFEKCGVSYAVVSIMGPQSSGKSTLLNHLFQTNFREMDAMKGRSQTTKGIWIARSVGIEPFTLVMDVEGCDGRERGPDDTTFEKQSACFALAVSDIVLINMWCHDIGRENGASKPLLRTMFQVMIQLFSQTNGDAVVSRRKTTLIFVIRDKTKTPLVELEQILIGDVQEIWDSVPKTEVHKDTSLSEFFNVEVVALPHYDYQEDKFFAEVENLRYRFYNSIEPGGLAGDRSDIVPASSFSFSAEQIWNAIKKNEDLDLPSHKIMVATVRCEKIASEKLNSFVKKEEWRQMKNTAEMEAVSRFVRKLTSMLEACLLEYDQEAAHFDEDVRSLKRELLKDRLMTVIQPTYCSMLKHTCSRILKKFKERFDGNLNAGHPFATTSSDCKEHFMSQFDYEASTDGQIELGNSHVCNARNALERDIDAYIYAVKEHTQVYEIKLNVALSGCTEVLLMGEDENAWLSIRKLVEHETEIAQTEFFNALSGLEVDDEHKTQMLKRVNDCARRIAEEKAREAAKNISLHMIKRFLADIPRKWTGEEDIDAIIKIARSDSLKLLSGVAAIRLDNDFDTTEKSLFHDLLDGSKAKVYGLACDKWDMVPSSETVLTPIQCKSIWVKFIEDTNAIVDQAISAKNDAARRTAILKEIHDLEANIRPPNFFENASKFFGYRIPADCVRDQIINLRSQLEKIEAKKGTIDLCLDTIGKFLR